MCLNTAGTSINTSLYISGTTILNNNMGIGTTSIISGVKLDCRGTIYTHSLNCLMIGVINSINANSKKTKVPGIFPLLMKKNIHFTAATLSIGLDILLTLACPNSVWERSEPRVGAV